MIRGQLKDLSELKTWGEGVLQNGSVDNKISGSLGNCVGLTRVR